MSVIFKIDQLCHFNGTTIAELEKKLGYSNGSIKKSSSQTVRSDRVIEIAANFNVSPMYLLSDEQYDICPVCAFAYDPLNFDEVNTHAIIHERFMQLRFKMGFLMNPSVAACKKIMTLDLMKNKDNSDDLLIHHYESLMLCDFTEYAKEFDYDVSISYLDFVRNQIAERKYFNIIPESVARNIALKHNVDLAISNAPLSVQIKTDKEFMQNISDMWRLPQDLKHDVYKAIRHAKRDYEDSQKVII